MRGVQISYLIEHPEYIPQLAQWLFEQWGGILAERTIETRIKKLQAHMLASFPFSIVPMRSSARSSFAAFDVAA